MARGQYDETNITGKYRMSSGNFNEANMKDIIEFGELEKVTRVLATASGLWPDSGEPVRLVCREAT